MSELHTRPVVEVTPAVPNTVEIVFENNQPIVDVVLEQPPIIEVAAIGLQGPPGSSADSLETHDFSISGFLSVKQGQNRIYFNHNSRIDSIWASVGDPPAGAPIRLDINRNGSSIFAAAGDRPEISAGTHVATIAAPAVTTLGVGDYLTVDVDQVGTSLPGAALTVTIRTKKL